VIEALRCSQSLLADAGVSVIREESGFQLDYLAVTDMSQDTTCVIRAVSGSAFCAVCQFADLSLTLKIEVSNCKI